MASFGYPKHKFKKLEFAQQHFWTQSSFWVKINFHPMVRWRGLGKINVHKIYNVYFLNGHKVSYLWLIYAFIIKQMQKNTFFEWNFIQKF
jgi:hypothetical protein